MPKSITDEQWISHVTKTYRDQSIKIYFFCTSAYAQDLRSLKELEKLSDLKHVPRFRLPEPAPTIGPSRMKRNISWATLAMISTLLISFGIYSSLAMSNQATAYSHELISDESTVKIERETLSLTLDSPTLEVQEAGSRKPSIPAMTLDERVTFGLPKGNVSLTFDDGPSPYSREIVDILKKYGVGGTFFFTGTNVSKYPEQVEYVKANGYAIGNHSMHHTNFTTLPYELQEEEFILTKQLIEEIIEEPIVLFRPPYGAMDDLTIELMEHHDQRMVLWNRDPEDWRHHNPEEIINYILDSDPSGAIILLHETQAVVDALPQIIEHLLEQELNVVNLH